MATKSPRLAELLAKVERLRGLEQELQKLDERRTHLRDTIVYVRHEIESARSDIEHRLDHSDGIQLPLPPMPPTTPDPPAGPAMFEPAKKKPRRIEPWRPGQPIIPSVAALLRAFPAQGVLSFRELQQLCPDLSYVVLRGRVNKARQYRLLESAGWGKFRVAEHARAAVFGGGLRVVD